LGFNTGALSKTTRATDNALLSHSFHHLFGGDFVGSHPVGVEPDPHGITATTQDLCPCNPLDPLNLRNHMDGGVVVQKLLIDPLFGTKEVDIHEHTGLNGRD